MTQLPAVYMPGVPSASVDRRGATPATPASGRTLESPRQMGGLGVAERVAGGVRLAGGLPVEVRVLDGLPVPERVAGLLPVAVRV